MAPDEYSTASGGGGRLKLKGAKVQDGRVEKRTRRKKKVKGSDEDKDKDKDKTGTGTGMEIEKEKGKEKEVERTPARDERTASEEERRASRSGSEAAAAAGGVLVGKTEAERRYEEGRKKRLNDRLKREGVKSHKERVEELNRYLSKLSEHHDMPKIGPG